MIKLKLIIFYTVILLISITKVFAQEKDLDYFIYAALQNSPLLKDYQNQILSSRYDSLRIRASLLPQVNGISNNIYAPNIKGWGYDPALTNGGQISALISVTKTLVPKSNLENQFQNIQLLNQSVANTRKISEQDLKKNITAQYINVYGDLQQLAFNREVFEHLQKEEAILKQLTEKVVYKQTDYLTFLVTKQQQELLIKQLSIQYQNDFATLNYISGLNDTSFTKLPDPALGLNELPELQSTVFYRQFKTDSLLLKNNDEQIDLSYKPKVNLFADAGFYSAFTYQGYKNFGTSFGVSLLVPIYDGKQKKMQHDKIAIAEDTRKQYADFFTKQYNQQIIQLQQQLQRTQELIDMADTQIKYADGLITANQKLMLTGDVRITDYILAINNYLNAKNIITQNTITKYQIINQINYWNRTN